MSLFRRQPARLQRVVPTDRWQLVLQFAGAGLRLLELSAVRAAGEWPVLGSPVYAKALRFDAEAVRWPDGPKIEAERLFALSAPLPEREFERQTLELGAKNQAPTPEDRHHDVYYVALCPFSPKPFGVGQSITGGHAERGGYNQFDREELLGWPRWREHFVLADCRWAIAAVERETKGTVALMDELVLEVCRRAAERIEISGSAAAKRAQT